MFCQQKPFISLQAENAAYNVTPAAWTKWVLSERI